MLVTEIAEKCSTAQIGCVDCKAMVGKEIIKALEPFRQRRAELASRPEFIRDVLEDGAKRARIIARETLKEAKERMGMV